MNKYSLNDPDRLKSAMPLFLTLMVALNSYLAGIFVYLGEYPLLSIPILAIILLVILRPLLKMGIVSTSRTFYGVMYLLVAEVSISNASLGWGCGFSYFLALFPAFLLLNVVLNITQIVSLSLQFLIVIVVFGFMAHFALSEIFVEKVEDVLKLNLLNAILTAALLVVLIYSRRSLHKND